MSKIVAGVDYSISSPGVYVRKADEPFDQGHFFGLSGTKMLQGWVDNIHIEPYPIWKVEEERFEKIKDWAMQSVLTLGEPDLVVIEGYSFGSKGKVFNLAENTGLLKNALYKKGYNYLTPSPPEVKKFATGKGNADKFVMWETFYEETGYDMRMKLKCEGKSLRGIVTDLVDAYWMFQFGLSQVN